jgi:hypothetical protein
MRFRDRVAKPNGRRTVLLDVTLTPPVRHYVDQIFHRELPVKSRAGGYRIGTHGDLRIELPSWAAKLGLPGRERA